MWRGVTCTPAPLVCRLQGGRGGRGGRGRGATAAGGRGGARHQQPQPQQQQQQPAAEEKLHPSWAARKAAKQKLAIAAPTGKKITFCDDANGGGGGGGGAAESQQQRGPQGAARGGGRGGGRGGAGGRGRSRGEEAASEEGLHPSWVAKKRLKQTLPSGIVPAAGKKIVFDD